VLKFPSVINQQLHAFLIPSWLTAKYFAYALRTQVGRPANFNLYSATGELRQTILHGRVVGAQ
jgi:hypothetical protein